MALNTVSRSLQTSAWRPGSGGTLANAVALNRAAGQTRRLGPSSEA